MHELSIARALIELADDAARRAGAGRIRRLHCRIGALRQIEDDLLQDAFDAAKLGTTCADAGLSIEKSPLRAACSACGRCFTVSEWNWDCPACAVSGEMLDGGDELELVAIDAEESP